MTPVRGSLHGRLTIAQALAAALVFLITGSALYKGLEAWLVEHDHEDLRRHAALVQRMAADCQALDDPATFQSYFDNLRLVSPNMQVVIEAGPAAARPEGGASGVDLAEAPIRTVLRHGVETEVLDLKGPCAEHLGLNIQVALPTEVRLQRLQRHRDVLVAVGVGGVLASALLSALVVRWGVARVRRLSAEAGRAAFGGRIATQGVDAELVGLVRAFNDTLDRLERVYRQSEAFSADVAHELRSPLATLISGTQVMLSGPPRSAAQLKEALASNLEELERLKDMVNDMLFLARADQGERAQGLERVDLGQLADATLDYCGVLLEDAGLMADRRGEASAVCNAALIRRAMTNLLSNAIQYAGGERRIEIRLEAMPGKVRVWVFNSGEPLAPEVAQRIFNRFFRASASRADRGERHGLGLAIVQAVARMHGGQVFVSPQADGNAIGFEIPGALATGQRRMREQEFGRR